MNWALEFFGDYRTVAILTKLIENEPVVLFKKVETLRVDAWMFFPRRCVHSRAYLAGLALGLRYAGISVHLVQVDRKTYVKYFGWKGGK